MSYTDYELYWLCAILTMRHTLQTESHVGLTRAHAARAIALLERPGSQADGQTNEPSDIDSRGMTNEQADIERQILLGSCLAASALRSAERRRRRLPGLVLRRHGSSYLGVSLVRRARLEPRRQQLFASQRRGPSPSEASVSAIYRMWDAGK